MRTTYRKSLQFILTSFLCLVSTFYVYTQTRTISTPKLIGNGVDYQNMCVRSSADVYPISFTYPEAFPAENVFHIELSDSEGNFDNPVDLKTIQGKNDVYYIRENITMPQGTYGDGYRIRVRATQPEEIFSASSDVFEAYYIEPSGSLILNNREDVVLCDGESKEISLNDDTRKVYVWYRNGTIISNESGSTLVVKEEGQYYAKPYYGDCSSSFSTAIQVIEFSTQEVKILGENQVKVCGDESYTLKSSIVDTSVYSFKWLKDGEEIVGATNPTYITPTSDQFGEYEVVLSPKLDDACISRSQKVTLAQKDGNDFSVKIEGASELVVLPSSRVRLEVSHTSSKAVIKWFRDGNEVPGGVASVVSVADPGVYYAEVTDVSSSCAFTKKSTEVLVLDSKGLLPVIKVNENYESCESTYASVEMVTVKVIATNDKEYSLTDTQLESLTFTWYRDGVLMPDSNEEKIKIKSYLLSGSYKLETEISTLKGESEQVSIALLAAGFELKSTSPSNVLCSDESIVLSVDPVVEGFTYQWYKDGEPIENQPPYSELELFEIGLYSVVVSGFGCEKLFEVEVKLFDESVVTTSPSNLAVLPEGGSVEIVAEGADSYEWYNSNDELVATTASYEVVKTGSYKIVAKVNECTVTKDIEVVEDDGNIIIPNILTPFNNDSVNDTWKLPNKYSFQKDVQVIIYNSQGKELINTTDYQNNWPEKENVKDGMFFYFKVLNKEKLIKAGTISVLK